MFIQLHALTSYPASLLNRDDAGFAKTIPFGGTTRTRVSSQCLKYHWRNFDGEHALYGIDVPKSLRSRETFMRRVVRPLVEDGYPAPLVHAVTYAIRERLLSDKKAAKGTTRKLVEQDEGTDPAGEINTNQIVVVGAPEVRYLRQLAAEKMDAVRDDLGVFWEDDEEPSDDDVEAATEAMRDVGKRDLKKNLKGLELASGLDAALFGRMATSDVLARGDAAIHVAHAFTTHAAETESDYFSAVDELRRDEPEASGELGAALIQTQELTSGLFYSYVVVDVPLLVSNLEGCDRSEWNDADRTLATEIMRRFVHLMTTVSPGAKLGSTAPYSYAQCLLAECGTAQPRTLANAFQQAVSASGTSLLGQSYDALGTYVQQMDQMYGQQTDRALAGMGDVDDLVEQVGVSETQTVPDVAGWVASRVSQ
jgi:CRISPR system Cascade subunit CasC